MTKDSKKWKWIIALVAFMFSPPIAIILIIGYIIYTWKQQGFHKTIELHKDNSYDENHNTDYHGLDRIMRDEQFNYTTAEMYNELLNHKTDYRGVNKDLL